MCNVLTCANYMRGTGRDCDWHWKKEYEKMSDPFYEGHRLTRKRSYAPRQDINERKAELVRLEAEQIARNLEKAPPNGKEKYLGNGRHEWEPVTVTVARLRVPGGWIYSMDDGGSVFVPLPSVLGYAV